MDSNINKFKEDLKKLIAQGEMLRFSMLLDLKLTDTETEKEIRKLKPPPFNEQYEQMCSAICPDSCL
jgi:hypothetical protein